MPSLKCPQCARELAAGAQVCPWDGTPINSVVARPSLWNDDRTITKVREKENGHTEDSEAPAAAAALTPGQKLGDYEVGVLLGSGGMGEVYAGEQPMIGKKVAIKVLKSEVAAEPGNVQRMLSEARSVNAIRHRSIVDIFNFGTLPDGRPYLVMEYLEGTALDTMLRKQGALIPAEVAEFLEEICSALAAAHGRGIVHRDLKPGNVFIVNDGNSRSRYVKLLDFGLAKGEPSGESSKQTRAGMVVGTPDYIAPEQARGGTITPRTDLYSLGVMTFEMLTGGLPFSAESVVELMMMHVATPAPRVSSKIDFCPPALDALVYQLMSKAPEDRPRSAEVVRQEVARIRRVMRESETMVGASNIPMVKETVEIPVPEANTPHEVPFLKDREQRTQPTSGANTAPIVRPRATGERTSGPVDATARYSSVQPREVKKPGTRMWLAAVALVGVLGAGVVWFFTRPPVAIEIVPPPPVDAVRVEPPRAEPEPPKVVTVPPKSGPTPPAKGAAGEPIARPPQKAVPGEPIQKPPRPTVVKAAPPRPAVVSAPSKEQLHEELRLRLRRKAVEPGVKPSDIEKLKAFFTPRINEARTPADHNKVLEDIGQIP